MNFFDSSILSFLNGFAHHSRGFDLLIELLEDNILLKGGIPVAILWWFWFQTKGEDHPRRERIILTFISPMVALFFARALAWMLPFRPRPLQNPDIHFILPYDMDAETLESWSSFPSDHAVLLFALAVGIVFISRKVGWWLIAYILVVALFPRLYLGIHYPTDLLAGALIGTAFTWFFITREKFGRPVARYALSWLDRQPGLFYSCFFLLSFEIGTMFDSVREVCHFIFRAVRAMLA